MRKVYMTEGLQCGNCAAKIQDAIAKLDGVNDVSVSFMTEKMKLDADPEKLDAILDEADKLFDKIEPGSRIVR